MFNMKAPVKPGPHSQMSGSETEGGPTRGAETSRDTKTSSDSDNDGMHGIYIYMKLTVMVLKEFIF